MKKYNCGKVFVEISEVRQSSNNSIKKVEVLTVVERTLWGIGDESVMYNIGDGNWIKYKGKYLRAYPAEDNSWFYRASA